MAELSPAALRQQIAHGKPAPLYLIAGDDEVEKGQLAGALAELVEEGLRAFNVERLHGGETNAMALLDAAQTLPLMVPRRVIVVLEAERLLVPKRESEAAARAAEDLAVLFKNPPAHAVIALVAGALDGRSRLVKLLLKEAVVVTCGGLETAADARRWIAAQVDAAGARMEPAAVNLLADQIGPDVSRLRGELERVLLFADGGRTVTVDDVRETVGAPSVQDEWAMTRAIEHGDAAGALRELALMLEGGSVAPMILGQLGWVVRTRLPASRVPDAVDALFRTDLDLKRSAGDTRVLLERLVVELCGGGGRSRSASARRSP
ncbi:MAG TPA: DNA polymerase III subunit delta [Vicinamibacterales bacterium]|nr:DNA polymerase III subunit delta [Vicinamibacterales bacterium]